MVAEPVAGQETAVAHEVLTALSAIADGDIPAESLTAWRDEAARIPLEDPGFRRGWVAARGMAAITGAQDMSITEHREEVASVDAAAVAAAAAEAAATSLYRLPPDVSPPPGIVRAPMWSPDLGAGRRHEERRSSPDGEPNVMFAGPLGVSLRRPDGNHVTITAGDAEVLLVWRHDLRTVIGADAANLDIDPAWWHDGLDLVRAVDAMVPAERHVHMRDEPDRPAPPPDIGEPASWWVLFVAPLSALAWLLYLFMSARAEFTVLPIIIGAVLTVWSLRRLQQTRRVRGLPWSSWPR